MVFVPLKLLLKDMASTVWRLWRLRFLKDDMNVGLNLIFKKALNNDVLQLKIKIFSSHPINHDGFNFLVT